MKEVNVKGEGVLTQLMGAVLRVVVVAVCDRYVCGGGGGGGWGGGGEVERDERGRR
jgi:hypothetical protein